MRVSPWKIIRSASEPGLPPDKACTGQAGFAAILCSGLNPEPHGKDNDVYRNRIYLKSHLQIIERRKPCPLEFNQYRFF